MGCSLTCCVIADHHHPLLGVRVELAMARWMRLAEAHCCVQKPPCLVTRDRQLRHSGLVLVLVLMVFAERNYQTVYS